MSYNPRLFWLAFLTALATWPLIFLGGLVTSHGAGMSVPDWPNSYGYSMWTFPVSKWVGGIFYEHTHRLMGTVVGFLATLLWVVGSRPVSQKKKPVVLRVGLGILGVGIALYLVGKLLKTPGLRVGGLGILGIAFYWLVYVLIPRTGDGRTWVRKLCAAVLGAVIFQGMLGGLRVVWVNLDLAIVHACFAQAFFCLASLVALVTSRWWIERENPQELGSRGVDGSRTIFKLAAISVVVIYGQLIVGAMMRHNDAGLAIPDLPLAYGRWLPPTTASAMELANQVRVSEYHLHRATLEQVWLHFGHRIGACLVTIAVIGSSWVALKRSGERAVRALAWVSLLLLVTQVTLGVYTVLWRKPADVASLHVATGALLLVTTFVQTCTAWHVSVKRAQVESGRVPTGFSKVPTEVATPV